MEYFEKEQIYTGYMSWNGGNGKESMDFRTSEYNVSPHIIYSKELEEFYKKYQDLKNKKVDITEEDSIYFFKESKYPRFKFNAGCNNKKTIQIDKATYAVTPVLPLFNTVTDSTTGERKLGTVKGVKCNLTNNLYLPYYRMPSDYMTKYGTTENALAAILIDKFLIQPDHYTIIDLVSVNRWMTGVKNELEYITTLYNNIDKCITDDQIETYLNKDNGVELTDEMYTQLENMLTSKDSKTIDLGVKMLNNFNLNNDGFRISLLIRTYANFITNGTAYQAVGFKNIIKQLNLNSIQNLKYIDNMQFLNQIYSSTTNDNQRSLIKYQLNKEIEKRMNDYINNLKYNNKHIPVNISFGVE